MARITVSMVLTMAYYIWHLQPFVFVDDYLTFPAIVLSENTSNCAVCSRAVSFWLWALSENRVLQNPAIYHLVSYSNGHSGVPPFSVKRNCTGNKYTTKKN